jgi:hypothetical protein
LNLIFNLGPIYYLDVRTRQVFLKTKGAPQQEV